MNICKIIKGNSGGSVWPEEHCTYGDGDIIVDEDEGGVNAGELSFGGHGCLGILFLLKV